MKIILRIFVMLILVSSALFAELNVYLIPRYDYIEATEGNKGIRLSDISKIDGSLEEIAVIAKTVMPEKISADGYIDRSEVLDFVKSICTGDIYVYGTSVKINKVGTENEITNQEYEVKSGSTVSFIVINNGITIRSQGIAVNSGKTGDTIQVKLKKSIITKGKVVTDKIVELEL